MTGRARMDSDEFYMAIESRPGNMTIPEAVLEYCESYRCSVKPECCESIRNGITRFHSHLDRIRRIMQVKQSNDMPEVVVESKPVEPVVTPEAIIESNLKTTTVVEMSYKEYYKIGDFVAVPSSISSVPFAQIKYIDIDSGFTCIKLCRRHHYPHDRIKLTILSRLILVASVSEIVKPQIVEIKPNFADVPIEEYYKVDDLVMAKPNAMYLNHRLGQIKYIDIVNKLACVRCYNHRHSLQICGLEDLELVSYDL